MDFCLVVCSCTLHVLTANGLTAAVVIAVKPSSDHAALRLSSTGSRIYVRCFNGRAFRLGVIVVESSGSTHFFKARMGWENDG